MALEVATIGMVDGPILSESNINRYLQPQEKGNEMWLTAATNIYKMLQADKNNGKNIPGEDKVNGKSNPLMQEDTGGSKRVRLVSWMLKEYQLFLAYKYDQLQYTMVSARLSKHDKQIRLSSMKPMKLALPPTSKFIANYTKLPMIARIANKDRSKEQSHDLQGEYHIHRRAESLFSTSSGFNNFRGFFNLAILLLILSTARVALENIIKYGVLINPLMLIEHLRSVDCNSAIVSIIFYSNVNIIFACCIERLIALKSISENCGHIFHVVNLSFQLGYPVGVILAWHPNIVYGSFAMLGSVIVFLKLISYKQTRTWCRMHMKRLTEIQPKLKQNGHSKSIISQQPVLYPSKLSFSHLYYFMCLPTLCYEVSFPRTKQIRKRFLLKRIAEAVVITSIILALIQQWVLPLIHNALVPFSQLQIPKMLERILKLAIPNFCIWLLWFYVTFHSIFNILAELLKFGDRNFYQDWWNAESVSEYWKKWNIPVHRWAIRHVYKPMLSRGYSKFQGYLVVFALSAFFHELLVSVPLGLFRLYAFVGMILQVPLAAFTAKLHGTSPKMCNIIMWLSLIIGQPAAVLMYYVDYYVESKVQ